MIPKIAFNPKPASYACAGGCGTIVRPGARKGMCRSCQYQARGHAPWSQGLVRRVTGTTPAHADLLASLHGHWDRSDKSWRIPSDADTSLLVQYGLTIGSPEYVTPRSKQDRSDRFLRS